MQAHLVLLFCDLPPSIDHHSRSSSAGVPLAQIPPTRPAIPLISPCTVDNNLFERLQADPAATMPPPGPREGSPSFFTTTPDYLFNASLTVVGNFKALSLQRGWVVNSPAWRRNWLACFGRAYTKDQNPFAGDGGLNFFATFPDYHADRTASVLENFKRLSCQRRWGVDSKLWRRQWRACFGRAYTEHDNPFDDSDSDSDDESYESDESDESDDSDESYDSNSEETIVRSDFAASSPSSGGQPTNTRDDRRPSLAEDFARFFGHEGDKLENWQRLCRIVGLNVGTSITQCRKVRRNRYGNLPVANGVQTLGARDVMINLVNLVGYMRGDAELIEFGSRAEFVRYTRVKRNMFSRDAAKDNGFLRALLREL